MKKLLILTFLIAFSPCVAKAQEVTTQNARLVKTLEKILKEENSKVKNYLARNYRNDAEMMMYLVKMDGTLIQYGSPELQRNREIALEAVKQNGLAIRYLNSQLKKDQEIILEAAKENIEALQFVRVRPKEDRKFILQILQNSKQINSIDNDETN